MTWDSISAPVSVSISVSVKIELSLRHVEHVSMPPAGEKGYSLGSLRALEHTSIMPMQVESYIVIVI